MSFLFTVSQYFTFLFQLVSCRFYSLFLRLFLFFRICQDRTITICMGIPPAIIIIQVSFSYPVVYNNNQSDQIQGILDCNATCIASRNIIETGVTFVLRMRDCTLQIALRMHRTYLTPVRLAIENTQYLNTLVHNSFIFIHLHIYLLKIE